MRTIFNEDKFAQLLLYVTWRSGRDPLFGSRKLNKILYWSDFLHYATYGESITGAEYVRREHGPAPAKLVPVRDRLIHKRELGMRRKVMPDGHIQKRVTRSHRPNVDLLSSEEIALVEEVLDQLWDKDGDYTSAMSHRLSGWNSVKDGETIPYASVFIPEKPLPMTPEVMEWVKTEVARFL